MYEAVEIKEYNYSIKRKIPYAQLTLIGVWSRVGHGENTSALVGKVGSELVLKGFTPDGLTSITCPLWVTALYLPTTQHMLDL